MGALQRWYRAPGGESFSRRVLLVTLAQIYSITSTGIVFGYSGLYDVFLFEVKAFGEYCEDGNAPCAAQQERLSRMFTIGATTLSGCAFLIGVFLDHMGPRITVCLGSLLLAGGLLSVAFAQELSSTLYYIGFFLMSAGGSCIANSTFNFGELFPDQSAGIIGALSTGFNSSTVVFCIFGAIIHHFDVSLKSVFIAYTALPVVIFISSVLLFPDRSFEPIRKNETERTRFKGELHHYWSYIAQQRKDSIDVETFVPYNPHLYRPSSSTEHEALTAPLLVAPADSSPARGAGSKRESFARRLFRGMSFRAEEPPPDIYNTAFSRQVNSAVYWSMAIMTAYVVLRVNYYFQTIYEQLLWTAQQQYPGDVLQARNVARYYTNYFNYLLPVGALLMIPVVGFCLSELGFVASYFILALLHLLFCVVNAYDQPPIQLQVASFVLFAALRPFLFGSITAFLGRVFGFKNFGQLYGLKRIMGALGTFLGYPLQVLTIHSLHNRYVYVNSCFIAVGVLFFSFPLYLWKRVFYNVFLRPPSVH